MSLFEKVSADLIAAMKNKEKEKLEALRAVKTAFILAKSETSSNSVLSEEQELKIIQKLVKQRKDSAAEYITQNRQDLAEKESMEASVIETYLPEQMSRDAIVAEVQKIIDETGAGSIKEMGKVMGIASKNLAGKADNKIVSEIVKELLG